MSTSLPLKIYPDPILRKKSQPLSPAEFKSQVLQDFIVDMAATMKANHGIGLAAVQVGRLIRMTVIDTKDGVLVLANPKITRRSWKKEKGEEGCLSIPGTFGMVKRAETITVTALDRHGEPIEFTAHGLFARVIQHELDHMDGVLFIDRTKEITTGDETTHHGSPE